MSDKGPTSQEAGEAPAKRVRKRKSGWDTPAPSAVASGTGEVSGILPAPGAASAMGAAAAAAPVAGIKPLPNIQGMPPLGANLAGANPAMLAAIAQAQAQQAQFQFMAKLAMQQQQQHLLAGGGAPKPLPAIPGLPFTPGAGGLPPVNPLGLLSGQSGLPLIGASPAAQQNSQANDPAAMMKAVQQHQAMVAQQQQAALQAQKAAQEAAAAEQAHKFQCRIYVGSLHYDLKETDLRPIFEAFGPVRTVDMSFEPATGKSKGFCFVEYENPDHANAAISAMNGFQLAGRPIKVGRPNNVGNLGILTPGAANPMSVLPSPLGGATPPPGLAAAAAPPPPNRVFLGNVHPDITEDDLRTVFSSFGAVKTSQLVDTDAGKHSGFGFLEFAEKKAAEEAVTHMAGFVLGGRPLKVGLALTALGPVADLPSELQAIAHGHPGSDSTMQQVAAELAARHKSLTSTSDDSSLAGEENCSINALQRAHIMQKLAQRAQPIPIGTSRCVVLKNMVEKADVDEDLESEVTDECGKYGTVERVVIYEAADSVIKLFVLFKTTGDAAVAKAKLNGRFFGGKVIVAELYDTNKFLEQNYRE